MLCVRCVFLAGAAGLLLLQSDGIRGGEAAGVVSHIKVLSDKVEDVSSLEAWKKACIKDGMTDEQKAMAVWQTVFKFQLQDAPPSEYLNENSIQDVIKIFNVYGYSMCGQATADTEALARHVGLKARGWTISHHLVSEIWWDDSWHMLDGSLINYFPKPDGKLAGVEEIIAGVSAWLGQNPGLKGNDAKLREFQFKGPGWKKGPEILVKCPTYSADGWLPAYTHGWYSTMQEYDGSAEFLYEPGYSVGYQVNIQLRKGERLTRNWSNKGLHLGMDGSSPEPAALKMKVGQQFLRYSPKYGDLANGRVGNGTLEYDVPLADGAFKAAALSLENLACKSDDQSEPAVHVKDGAAPGTLILRMPSSYVYLGGELACKATVAAGGEISALLSDNNGLDWKELAEFTASGEQKVDLKPLIFRRYDYRLKFVLRGKGTGLDALRLTHDIQHSQRPLPALGQGANTITFTAGPQEGTITIEPSTNPANKGKQLTVEDYHAQAHNIQGNELPMQGAQGDITFPIATPGDMTRLRLGAFYRARDPKEGWELQVSYDGGKTFKTMDRLPGETGRGVVKFITYPDIPPGTRAALVRYTGTKRTACMLMSLRIDADYLEPNGGFRPVKIAYNWEENGQEKQDVHVARQAEEKYNINCATKPTMKSVVLELAE